MQDMLPHLLLAVTAMVAITTVAFAALRGWSGWLDYKRLALTHAGGPDQQPPASLRIEMAALKERIRKLEAIAAGVDI